MPENAKNENRLSFYPRPMALLAMGFCAGVLLGRYLLPPAAWLALGLLAALALIAGILSRAHARMASAQMTPARMPLVRMASVPLLLLGLCAGLGRIQLAYPALPAPAAEGAVSGRIVDTPRRNANSWSVTLGDAAFEGEPIEGKVLLTVVDREQNLSPAYGQLVEVAASLSLPQGKRGDGGRDWRFYYFSKGISCTALGRSDLYVTVGQSPPGLYGSLLRLREYTTAAMAGMLGPEAGGIAAAMLHGDSTHIPEEALGDFRDAGVAHLLAVSGLHVGLLTGALLFLLRRLKPGPQLGVMAAFLVCYCLFTALSPSTVRASLMALCMLSAKALWRRNDPLSGLCFSLLVILLVSPFSLFDIGLQLSYTAVLGILLVMPVLRKRFEKLPGELAGALSVSIAGQVSTLPVSAAYFSRLPLLAVLANLLIVPLAALVVLPALCALCLYPLLPGVARVVAGVAESVILLMRAVASLASGAGALRLPAPGLGAGALYFLALLFCSPYCRGLQAARRKYALLCGGLCLALWAAPLVERMGAHVTVLDAQRGYIAHLHTPEEDRILASQRGLDANAYEIAAYLAARGIEGASVEAGEREGGLILLGEVPIRVTEGYAEVGGARYDLAQTGQLRVVLRRGRPHVRAYTPAYARDDKYAILMKK